MYFAQLFWIVIQVIIGYNLVLPVLLYIIFLFRKKTPSMVSTIQAPDYAVIVTAYEQTDSLPAVVASLLKLNYERFLVYVVADKCDITHLNFADDRVILLRPKETLAGNTRSHFYAIQNFKRAHDHLVIIDSDNLVHQDLLVELNHFFALGFKAVQGKRDAKNLDTTYARLDAARDIYYHFYDGEVLFKLGSSATLSGSGMAFTTALYRSCLENRDVSGAGFDKVLQTAIVEQDLRIAFAEKALVYDEKTSRSDQLVQQRARWINTWFRYFQFGFKLVGKGISRLSWNQFLFGLVLLRPPLFLFILGSLFCMLIDLFISPLSAVIWAGAFILFITGFLLAFTHAKTDQRIYKALISIPRFIFFQVLSLFKAAKANQHSVATRHFHNTTDL